MQRVVLLAVVVIVSFFVAPACGPQVPVPSGTGGGLASSVGGGSTSADGGRAGGSATGGGSAATGGGSASTAGGSAGDGGLNCTTLQPVAPPFVVPGGFFPMAQLEYWGSTVPLLSQQTNRLTLFNSQLYQLPNQRITFPFAGALPAGLTYDNCQVCFLLSIGCDQNGENCQGGEFLATSGNYNFTEGTLSPDAGRFSGGGTDIVYRQWDFPNDRPANDNCFRLASITFNAVWPFSIPDAGVDGGM